MEDQIEELLRDNPNIPFSVKMVGKTIDRERYREDPNWALEYLEQLVRSRVISSDAFGYWFQFKERDHAGNSRMAM